ncbi:radical SAM protein [Mitsuaria sp. WAJ17]|uniref:radical SAM protein n=1 Tax=Mitsuaria sp. WAJ17 TaxID=2761452 RepID=UPI0016042E0B|nr:radical SAM protein [Mitsuaria sp. WAJ17]MBB2487760.1 radical SAM protein [Mitsuaria sp. WAJ17]
MAEGFASWTAPGAIVRPVLQQGCAGPTGVAPIIQLHPTRLCNLACAHCYTASGPKERQQLPLALLCAVLDDAAALGYRQLAVSGGEPLLYEDLPGLLLHARRLGLLTSLTSNGLLLSPRRWAAIAPLLDRLAISVDGREATHDALRGQPGALARTLHLLAQPRATGTPFGFIFTLTQHNVDELEDVVGLAAAHGAQSVQVHPLTLHGRARDTLLGARPDGQELLAAIVEAQRLAQALQTRSGVRVQVDALSQDQIRAHRDRLVPAWPASALTTLAPVLVLQSDGQVLPLTHELPPALWLGSVHEMTLKALTARWLHSSASRRLVEALERTWQALAEGMAPAAYWYDEVAARARPADPPLTVSVSVPVPLLPSRGLAARGPVLAQGARQ